MSLLQSVTLVKLKEVGGPSTMLNFFGIELNMIDSDANPSEHHPGTRVKLSCCFYFYFFLRLISSQVEGKQWLNAGGEISLFCICGELNAGGQISLFGPFTNY